MKRAGFGWWLTLILVCLLGGGLLSAAGWLPFEAVKGTLDRLSPDGNLKVLTESALGELLLPLRLGGMLLWVFALFGLLAQKRLLPYFSRISPALRALPGEGRQVVGIFRPGPGEAPYWVGVLLVTAGGVLARLLFLTDPMAHDESYTYIAFAARPWWNLLSDYHLPNNHIFHSVLVKLSTGALGMQPWAVRLPALVSGVLCIPAVYGLGKRLYGRPAGLLSAGLLAALPVWIDYNTNARGYSQMALFSVLLFGLAVYLSEHKNRAGWLIFSIVGALGFFTLPPMLYPFGMTLAWLGVTALSGGAKVYGGARGLLGYLVFFAGLTLLLSALCYVPVVMGSGLGALLGNPFVARLNIGDFLWRLDDRLVETWLEWSKDIPLWGQVLFGVGFAASLGLHRRISRVKVAGQITTLGWLAAILLLQRPDPNARLWTFLIPFFGLWLAAGWLGLLGLARIPVRWRTALIVLTLVLAAVFSWQRTLRYFPSLSPGPGDVERIAGYLQPLLEPGDGVIVTSDDGPALWYYLRLQGVDDRYYVQKLDERTLQRVFVLVNESQGQTLESAVEARKLPELHVDFVHAGRLTRIGGTVVYRCEVGYNQ